jgi:hypothetical protein
MKLIRTVIIVGVCAAVASAGFAKKPKEISPGENRGNGNSSAENVDALFSLTSGLNNTAHGANALFDNTSGNNNTADGLRALSINVTGNDNTGVGFRALFFNTASNNTGVGSDALLLNTTGLFNDAVGANALSSNVDGVSNNAFGESALFFNVHGSNNTAIGDVALALNDSSGNGSAQNNTAVGAAALFNNTDGSENTAVGTGAGTNVVTGSNNTYVGDFVGVLAPDESNTIRIGDLSNGNGAGSLACFIGGIFNNFQPAGGTVVEVTLDLANDKLGWDIGAGGLKPTVPLRPSAPAHGVPSSLSRPPRHPYAMLDDKVGKLEIMVAQQQKQIETLTAELKEQATQIQKVGAKLQLRESAPRTVQNN